MTRFNLLLFGTPRLERAEPGREPEPVEMRRRKGMALLVYLALKGERQSREELAALLWPESEASDALGNLRRELYRLKGDVGEELLRAGRQEVAIEPELDLWVDVLAFKELLGDVAAHGHFPAEPCEGCLEKLKKAVALYEADFMAGFTLPDCPAFDRWQFFEGDGLRLALAEALQQLVRWHKGQQAFEEALRYGRRWLALDPLHEAAQRELMALYALAGQAAAALRQYDEYVRLLDEELGVAPEEATSALYEAIRERRFPEARQPAARDLLAGSAVTLPGERYVLEEQLSVGGQGAVFRGRDRETGEPVIIKQLRPERLADAESVARFLREGEALRQLDHPNIVRILATFQEEEQHSIVMEYVPGGTLAELLEQEGPLPLEQLLNLALELADALSRAHHLGILHRDIKPENVLLTREGAPRLTDFGLARLEAEDVQLTQTGSVLGSPAYMSPEALRGEALDTRSDVWSFGVLLYEMIAGKRPFDAETVTRVLVKILNDPTPDLTRLRPDAPPALVALIELMLVKEREGRPASMRWVASTLEAIRAGAGPDEVALPTRAEVMPAPPKRPEPVRGATPAAVEPAAKVQAPPAPTETKGLPARSTPFVGRLQELEELAELLANQAVRLLTILGPGGIGKTQLALQAARQAAGTFADGVFFVPLAPISSPEELVFTIAEGLDLHFYQQADARRQLFEYLQRKELLLVLDNFEHLVEGATLLADIAQVAPGVKLLVTSRSALNLSLETLYTLSGLSFPREGAAADDVTASPAVQLLLQQARLVRPNLRLDAGGLRDAARVVRLVEGMPLAVVLAASWAELLSMKEIGDEIARNLDFLETRMRDVPQRQRSVRAAFDYSWQQLPAEVQQVFARLTIFRGGFTRHAAQAVAGADLRTLLGLVRKSFLVTDRRDRYEIHELLRQYGQQKLEALEEVEAVRDAHASYYLRFLGEREAELKGGRQAEVLREVEVDFQNIRGAWNWALERGDREGIDRGLETLHLFCDIRGRHLEGIELFARARAALAPGPGEGADSLWGRIVTRHGFLQVLVPADPEAVRAEVERGLTIAEQHEDDYEIGIGSLALGLFSSVVGQDAERGRSYNQRAYELMQRLGEPFFMARALVGLGIAAAAASEPAGFADYVQESVRVARAHDNKVDMALGLANLTEYAVGMGQYDRAEANCSEAMMMAREIGAPTIVAFCQAWLGALALFRGDLEQAEVTLRQSHGLAEDIHSQTVIAYACGLMAVAVGLRGEFEVARQLAEESAANPANNTLGLVVAPWALAIACQGMGEPAGAWEALWEGLEQSRMVALPAPPLWLLPVAVVLLVEEGEDAWASELLALATTHQLSAQGWLKRWPPLQGLHGRLEAALGQEGYEAAWERGRKATVDGVVERLLERRG